MRLDALEKWAMIDGSDRRSTAAPDVLLMTTNFGLELLQEPYGIAILSALMQRDGVVTDILEPAVDALDWEQCLDVIIGRSPRILGISMLFDTNMPEVLSLVRGARAALPDLNVFVGGQAPTVRHSSELFAPLLTACDALLIGEAEISAPKYVRRVLAGESWTDLSGLAYRDADGHLVATPPAPRVEDLDQLPLPDRSVLRQILDKHPGYASASVQAGRGCDHNCSFCTYGTHRRIQHGLSRSRRRSVEKIYEELEYLFHEFGIRDFHIEDESLLSKDPEHRRALEWLAGSVAKLPDRVTFDALARIDCVDRETCRALKQAGLTTIYVGIDSIDSDDLKLFAKGYGPRQVHEGMRTLLDLGYSLDVDAEFRVSTGYITWHPYSTLERVRNSLEFFKSYRTTPKLIQHFLFIYSGAPLKRRIEADGLLLEGENAVQDARIGFRFLRPEVGALFEHMHAYFDEWSPLRDGIRLIEKVARFEARDTTPELELLIRLRRSLDGRFFEVFENMLTCAESGRSG